MSEFVIAIPLKKLTTYPQTLLIEILLTVFMICIREVTGSLATLEYVIVAP